MSVKDWCLQQGITKANYYYRLRRVRQACIERIPNDMLPKAIVPVPNELIEAESKSVSQSGLDISITGCSIHVAETTSMELLASVLEVIRRAQ